MATGNIARFALSSLAALVIAACGGAKAIPSPTAVSQQPTAAGTQSVTPIPTPRPTPTEPSPEPSPTEPAMLEEIAGTPTILTPASTPIAYPALTPASQPTLIPTLEATVDTPAQTPAKPSNSSYYTQYAEVKGIFIKANSKVDPRALESAKSILEIMLSGRPDIPKSLREKRAELAIIAKDDYITKLPEFSYLAGRTDPNGNPYDSFKVRGAGAIPAQPVTATSEENLLKQDKTFWNEDITYHEYAHAIMNLAFTPSDHAVLASLYNSTKKSNLFPGAFAMVNRDEFWAELTQSYFNVNNEIGGREAVRIKAPGAFAFLEHIYMGRPLPESLITLSK